MLLLLVPAYVASVFLALGVVCLPLTDQGLHMADDWGQSVRLKHLYAASPGLHLLIGEDGRIQGSAQQSPYSKSSTLRRARDAWRLFHTDDPLTCRPAGDQCSGSGLCGHQRSSNRTVSLHRRRWKTVLIGEDNLPSVCVYFCY